MFDHPGAHLYIPAPPAMMSAAASATQSATTKRHLEALGRTSSYVQFASPPKKWENHRVALAHAQLPPAASTNQYDIPATLHYAPTSSMEAMALSFDVALKVAQREADNAVVPGGDDTTTGGGPTIVDYTAIGRERALCSSPRGQMAAADRLQILSNIEISRAFAESLASQSPRIQETLSPRRENEQRIVVESPRPADCRDAQTRRKDDPEATAGSARGTRQPTSSFASNTTRFINKPTKNPPVGHYTSRYAVVERAGRSASLRDSRQLGVGEGLGAVSRRLSNTGINSNKGSADFVTVDAADAASVDGGLANDNKRRMSSARERAKQRIASAPQPKARPTSAFASVTPQLYFHEIYHKQHNASEGVDAGYEVGGSGKALLQTSPRHNDAMVSTSPRVMSASFKTMVGRKGEAFVLHSSAPPGVLVYHSDGSTIGVAPCRGSVDMCAHSPRKPSHIVMPALSIDTVNLRESDRIVSPRVVSVPSLDKVPARKYGAPANSSHARDKDIPSTVAVDLIEDRRALYGGIDRHLAVPELLRLGRPHVPSNPVNDGGAAEATSGTQPQAPFSNHHIANPFAKAPHVDFQMHSSHHDVKSFAQQATQRIVHGDDAPASTSEVPSIELTRPRFIRDIELGSMPSRSSTSARADRAAQEALNRPELETVDSPLRHPRVIGDPHIGAVTSREQQSKRGGRGPCALDKFYDVSYATSGKVKQVHAFATQLERSALQGNRATVAVVNHDNVPGPGTYL